MKKNIKNQQQQNMVLNFEIQNLFFACITNSVYILIMSLSKLN